MSTLQSGFVPLSYGSRAQGDKGDITGFDRCYILCYLAIIHCSYPWHFAFGNSNINHIFKSIWQVCANMRVVWQNLKAHWTQATGKVLLTYWVIIDFSQTFSSAYIRLWKWSFSHFLYNKAKLVMLRDVIPLFSYRYLTIMFLCNPLVLKPL